MSACAGRGGFRPGADLPAAYEQAAAPAAGDAPGARFARPPDAARGSAAA